MIWPNAKYNGVAPFTGALAPDQSVDPATASDSPEVVVDRQPVGALVGRLPGRTLSAGSEVASIPQLFDLPSNLRSIYARLRGGHRTTLLAPELQSELDSTNATVMPVRGMNSPYVVTPPGPWYDSFVRTING